MRRLMSINSALQYIVIVLACLVAFARNVHGAGTSQPSVAQTVSVDVNSVGDASVVLSFQTDQKSVDFWQEKHASAGAFVRWMHLDNSWSPRQNEALTFGAAKDGTIPVTVEYTMPGMMRRTDNNEWSFNLGQWTDVATGTWQDGGFVAVGNTSTDFGRQSRQVTFRFASIQGQPRIEQKNVVVKLAPPSIEGAEAGADFRLEVAPEIMACMAKSYGYEKFPKLWVARATLKNTGGKQVTAYRVRFRLSDFAAEWSPWSRTASVYGGQSVVDAFFPLMNIDKLALVQGRRQALVETEYEYHLASGQIVHEVEGKKIEILGPNERIKTLVTGLKIDADKNVYTPYIIASFVSKDDPVIRMAAGRICGQRAGLEPSTDGKNAMDFLRQTHRFLLHNKIAYQTPPGQEEIQHYKYGREVLENRAGTCVDLAMFYASECEAVGLEPVIFMPIGHAFPMVKVPLPRSEDEQVEYDRFVAANKKDYLVQISGVYYIPMEATSLDPQGTFEAAVSSAKKEYEDAVAKPPYFMVDVAAQRKNGVYPMEMPTLAGNVLEQWGITAAPAGGNSNAQGGNLAAMFVGDWTCGIVIAGQPYTVNTTINADGTLSGTCLNVAGQVVGTGGGKWTLTNDGVYHFSGTYEEDATIRFPDKDTYIYTCRKSTNPIAIPGAVVTNRRVK